MRNLNVYVNGYKAGTLTETGSGRIYNFLYNADYLNSTHPAVSVNLPKREKVFESEYLFPFFSNMVPEGANRKVICTSLRIDENDFFGLLYALADKDTIGAVQLRKTEDDGN